MLLFLNYQRHRKQQGGQVRLSYVPRQKQRSMLFDDSECVCGMFAADFHYPVMDEDAPDYYSIVQNPMDIITLLQHVDNGRYLTCSAFLQDVDLIPANAKAYNGDDYNGARIVSRAYALRDAVLGMLSQMDPALVAFCDKISAQGGPTRLREGSATNLPSNPVAQPVHVTRASARLRNVQPDMNVSQSYELLKRSKRNNYPDQGEVVAGNSDPFAEDKSLHPPGQNAPSTDALIVVRQIRHKGVQQCEVRLAPTDVAEVDDESKSSPELPMSKHLAQQIESIEEDFVRCTQGYGISELERLYTQICQRAISLKDADKPAIVKFLKDFSSDESNF